MSPDYSKRILLIYGTIGVGSTVCASLAHQDFEITSNHYTASSETYTNILVSGSPEQDNHLIIDQNIERSEKQSALIENHKKTGLSFGIVILFAGWIIGTKIMGLDQFIREVLKYGIPGKEPEYNDDNESQSLVIYIQTR